MTISAVAGSNLSGNQQGWPSELGQARTKELLDYLEVGHRAAVKPALLSGGEAQRIRLAAQLARR